ncbi:MAG: cytochrome c biogenesis CcdA family protein [Armatimonadota bacterium]
MTSDPLQVGWLIPFLAGAVSFLSPCVLPLIPGYLSYISGVSMAGTPDAGPVQTGRVLGRSLLFVLGFALVFVALGASASAIGAVLIEYRPVLNRVAGMFIIVMGLQLLGVLRFGPLATERRFHVDPGSRGGLSTILLGGAFAFAWTPCIGPILASVLVYAGSVGTVKTGALLLLAYALGLGLPFVLAGLIFTRGMGALRWLRRFSGPIEATSGMVLVVVGAPLLANKMFYVSIWAQRIFIRFGLDLWRFF